MHWQKVPLVVREFEWRICWLPNEWGQVQMQESKGGRNCCHDWKSQWQRHDGRAAGVAMWRGGAACIGAIQVVTSSQLYWCLSEAINLSWLIYELFGDCNCKQMGQLRFFSKVEKWHSHRIPQLRLCYTCRLQHCGTVLHMNDIRYIILAYMVGHSRPPVTARVIGTGPGTWGYQHYYPRIIAVPAHTFNHL